MKHATEAALEALSDLLEQVRTKGDLKAKRCGIFYRKSKSFLDFHEGPAGLFADLGLGRDFAWFPVNSEEERRRLLSAIDRALGR